MVLRPIIGYIIGMQLQPKRKRGRPRVDSQVLNIRLQRDLMAAIDASAARAFEGRSYAVRRILAAGLKIEAVGSSPMRSGGGR
jgi:hypothetical protein